MSSVLRGQEKDWAEDNAGTQLQKKRTQRHFNTDFSSGAQTGGLSRRGFWDLIGSDAGILHCRGETVRIFLGWLANGSFLDAYYSADGSSTTSGAAAGHCLNA